MDTKNFARALAGSALAGIVLVGCASGTDPASTGPAAPAGSPATTSAQGQQNDADVAFAQGMIPHHRQAVEMAGLAASQSQTRRSSISQVESVRRSSPRSRP